jgi:hypothetical protein
MLFTIMILERARVIQVDLAIARAPMVLQVERAPMFTADNTKTLPVERV